MGWIIRDVDDLRRVMEPLEKKFDGDDEKIDQYMKAIHCDELAREWRYIKGWYANPPGQRIKEMYTAVTKAEPRRMPVPDPDDEQHVELDDEQQYKVKWNPPGWFRRRGERFEERLRNTPW